MRNIKEMLAVAVLLASTTTPLAFAAQNPANAPTKTQTVAMAMLPDKDDKEKHPAIRDAMNHLRMAREILEKRADNDFKGHKAEAIKSIDQAMEHLRQALAADTK